MRQMGLSSIFCTFVLAFQFSSITMAGNVVSKISPEFERSGQYWKGINQTLSRKLEIPFYFNAPYSTFSPLSEDLLNQRTSSSAHAPILFNYRETSKASHNSNEADDLGLRLIVVRGDNRKSTSMALADSGLFETGDIVLSYRPEWYGTLRYSHIQMGISHAGMLYYKKTRDGQLALKNLDMPFDSKHVGEGYLNSPHYLGATFLHVVRAKNLTDKQKENMSKWLELMAGVGADAYESGKMRFNQDYSAAKFKEGENLKFVGDLGRIALGIKNKKQLTNYCSEFVWSMLSLRNCDPANQNTRNEFVSSDAPTCIEEVFSPMPVLGTVTAATDLTDETLTVGLADGVPLLLKNHYAYISDPAVRIQLQQIMIDKSVLGSASGKGENISSGHRAVEEMLEKSNPNFFDHLGAYFKLLMLPDAAQNPIVNKYQAGFNASQGRNYSPTAFMVHAVLPPETAVKSMEYVGTIYFAGKFQTKKGTVDTYDMLRSIDIAK